MTRARDLANLIGSGNFTTETLTATAGQTAFTPSNTFTSNFLQVFYNGLLLDPTVDYTENGTTITLTVAATAGDEMEVVTYNTFSVGDAITQTEADNRYVNASGDTLTGTLNLPDDTAMIRRASNAEWVMGFDATNNILSIGTQGGATANRLQLCSGGNKIAIEADGSGRVTMPYQPAFLACKDDNSGLIGSGAYVFDDVFINTGNSYNPSTGRFTAPTTGVYWFTTTLQMWGMSVGSYCQFTFFKNGAGYPYSLSSGSYGFQVITQKTGATDYHNSVSLSGAIQLNVGDYVNVEMLPSGYARGMQSHFSGYLIG